MVIDRADRIINLCEMKFSVNRYMIDRDYEMLLRDRMAWFIAETKTRKAPVITMITTYGILPNKHSGIVQNEVTLDDLFNWRKVFHHFPKVMFLTHIWEIMT